MLKGLSLGVGETQNHQKSLGNPLDRDESQTVIFVMRIQRLSGLKIHIPVIVMQQCRLVVLLATLVTLQPIFTKL